MRRIVTTIGVHGRKVRVEERSDRAVRLRWWSADARAHQTLRVPVQLRDKRGRIRADALGRVMSIAAAIMSGQQPMPSQIEAAGPAPRPTSANAPGPTLEQAFESLLDSRVGKWLGETAARSEAVTKAADVVVALGPRTLLANLHTADYRTLWRALAARYATREMRTLYVGRRRDAARSAGHTRGKREIRWGGRRHCEQCVLLLRACLLWSADHGQLAHVPSLPRNWQEELAADWERTTGEEPAERDVAGPAYSPAEASLIYAEGADHDPRIQLAIELALELRLGQVIRTTRCDLDLNLGAHGRLRIRGRGRKKGATIFLDATMRQLIDRLMSVGYLQPLEAARRDGRIRDYPLFPGGRIGYGFDPKRNLRPLTKSGARTLFLAVEKAAGVQHVRGRAWYGFRRLAADLAEEIADSSPRGHAAAFGHSQASVKGANDEALNAITGHSDTRSRRRYQKAETAQIQQQATQLRRGIREMLVQPPDATRPTTNLTKRNP